MDCPESNPLSLPKNCNNELQDQKVIKNKNYNFNNMNANITNKHSIVKKSQTYNSELSSQNIEIERNWNWLINKPNIISDGSLSQESCGSCWAFSLASVLSDIYALTYDIPNPNLSPLWLLTCANNADSNAFFYQGISYGNDNPLDNSKGCCGGNNFQGAKWLEQNKKIGTLDCWPLSKDLYNGNSITNTCLDNSQLKCYNCDGNKYNKETGFGVKEGSTKMIVVFKCDDNNKAIIDYEQTILNIKKEIKLGPVMSNIIVPIDFQDWWNNSDVGSTYKNTLDLSIKDNVSGAHAVCLVGWGTDDNGDYWIMRNSWGLTHGTENPVGFCKIEMSQTKNVNYLIGIDIPISDEYDCSDEMNWRGGVVSIKSDVLPLSWQDRQNSVIPTIKPTGKGAEISEPPSGNISILFKKYWMIFVLICIIIIIIII